MFEKTLRIFTSLAAIAALGFGGAMAHAQQPADPWEPEPYDEREVDIDIDVDVDDEEPEIVPPTVPVAPEMIETGSINPLVGADPIGRFAVDFGLNITEPLPDVTTFMTSAVLQARVPVTDFGMQNTALEIGADWGVFWITPLSDPGDTINNAFGIGNPVISTHFAQSMGTAGYRIGLALGIPVFSQDPDTPLGRLLGYRDVVASRAGQDIWHWRPDRLSLLIPARVEGTIDRLVLGADATVGWLFWTGEGTQDTDFVTQVAGEIGYQIGARSSVGLRALGLWAPEINDDQFAFALEPGFRTGIGNMGFMGLRLTLPLTDPYGFAFDQGSSWMLGLTFGTRM
jgi:hypothetical protein